MDALERLRHDRRFISEETCKSLEDKYGIVSGDSVLTIMKKMIAYHGGDETKAHNVWQRKFMGHNLCWHDEDKRLLGWR